MVVKKAESVPAGGLTAGDMLDSIPVLNQAAKITRTGDSTMVEVPTRRPSYLVPPISWIIRFSGKRRISLDGIGSEMLDLCDGNRTVEEVVERFAVANKLSFREAQIPIIQFLTLLVGRGILALAFPKQ